MKRLAVILLAISALLSCTHDDIVREGPEGVTPPPVEIEDDADDVNWPKAVAYAFDESVIPEIHISVSREEWERLLKLYDQNSNTQEYIHCDILYIKGRETTLLEDSALRLKGNTSRRRPQDGDKFRHIHFGINFHHWHNDASHTLKGLRKVDLKWFKDDPMYVREVYCYDLFRREGVWTAIRDIYCRVWLKVGDGDELYYGVYGMMEHIDKNYLRIRKNEFGSKDGNLWKCRYGATLKDVNTSIGADNNSTDYLYELKTNKEKGLATAKEQLQDFIRNLNNLSGSEFDKWISSHMDVDMFLKTLAVNVAVGMWDDYWNNSNNYYLYFNSTDTRNYKVWFIPYDYDNTLGTSQNCGVQSDAGRQNPLQWGHQSYPLCTKILQNETWKKTYISYLKQLCSGNFSASASKQRIQQWQGRIQQYVSNDTGEDMKIEDRPAPWGNHGEYRLLSSSNNFFDVKASVVNSL
ncbi:MAG: CotH kinase family protein [Bacteroidales bacterium]|nr:CotH kinase family protein [Bacteroidales bacterium]